MAPMNRSPLPTGSVPTPTSCWQPISRCQRTRLKISRRATGSWWDDVLPRDGDLCAIDGPLSVWATAKMPLPISCSCPQRFQHALRRERQMAQAFAGKPVERVRDRAGDEGVADLAQTGRSAVDVDEPDVELLRQVRHAHDAIVVEVRLLHGAVPDCDALMQYAGQPVEDATLHVRPGCSGLHDDTAVDRRPHFVHADLAGGTVERDLDGTRTERTRTLGDRDPDCPPLGALGLVVRHLCQRLEHLARFGCCAHAFEPEFDRIDGLIDRHLIDEAFDRKRVEHVTDRAPVLELDAV